MELVAEAWARRVRAARAEGFEYVHALINEGRAAGASLPHSHSQLVWMREPPPAVVEEGDLARREFDLLREIHGRPDPASSRSRAPPSSWRSALRPAGCLTRC